MENSADDECPVCKGTIQNPSEPSPCCRKVFCRSCLTQSTRARFHCPYCRSSLSGQTALAVTTVFVPRGFRLPGLPSADENFGTARPVGNNIQNLLNQLSQEQTQAVQEVISSHANPANQAAPASAAPASLPVSYGRRRPVPAPRVRGRAFNLPAPALVTVAAVQTAPAPPRSFPVNPPTPPFDDLIEDLAAEISLPGNTPSLPVGSSVRTFSCPYCQEDGLDDLDLRDHCNDNHYNDPRRVVCPVCVSLPHGDPEYCSRDFIGHLNLRHCYYISDMTNVHQSDDANLQAAILNSIQDARYITY